jgi:hypothetical protein
MKEGTRASPCAGSASSINQPVTNNLSSPFPQADHRRIPPLTWHAGTLTDVIMDRIALHLRRRFPEQFEDMTLHDISVEFDRLRNEIRALEEMIGDGDENQ